MPYLSIQTNQSLSKDRTTEFLQKASQTVSAMLGKSENYVMVALQDANQMTFAGSTDPTAYLQLKSLGLPEAATGDFSRLLCDFIHQELDIPAERIYIEFSGPERHLWGWNNKTF